MPFAATTAVMKEMDRIAIQDIGIPSLELMEHAATAVAKAVMEQVPLPENGNDYQPTVESSVILQPEDHLEGMRGKLGGIEEYEAILDSKKEEPTPRVAVFCGPGNNGGDGLAAARLLKQAGYMVRVFLVGDREKMTPDSRSNEARLAECGLTLEPFTLECFPPKSYWEMSFEDGKIITWISSCDAIVDALFGVGLKRPLQGSFLAAVSMMNRYCSRSTIVACDVPSGLNADTGEILGEAVHAKVTVTFSCMKVGFGLGDGLECTGEIRVADIGIPEIVRENLLYVNTEQIVLYGPDDHLSLPRRPRTGHKGTFGRLFVLAGSEGYTGAPDLTCRGALRTGAGLVYLAVPRNIYPILAVKSTEAMPFPLPESYEALLQRASACDGAIIGPGLGRAPETEERVLNLLRDLEIPVVLDADGINALAGHLDVLDARRAPTILTPHDGEFARLTGQSLPIENRVIAAREFAKAHNCVLVLKGHGTVVASPDGTIRICGAGNPGMATGGSGDVLSGILGGLLVQKQLQVDWDEAAIALEGVHYHALAGDRCAKELGEYGMLPSDLLEMLPKVLKDMEESDC